MSKKLTGLEVVTIDALTFICDCLKENKLGAQEFMSDVKNNKLDSKKWSEEYKKGVIETFQHTIKRYDIALDYSEGVLNKISKMTN